MEEITFTQEEKIELLQYLLVSEQEERRQIAKVFHEKKNELLFAGFPLQRIAKSGGTPSDIQEVQKTISDFLADSRQISATIFPATVYLNDLLFGLRTLARAATTGPNGVTIEINSTLSEFTGLNRSKEFGVYRLCREIIEFLEMFGKMKIQINAEQIKTSVLISIETEKTISKKALTARHYDKTTLIKARMVLQNAKIYSETNWTNSFVFRADAG